MVGNAVDPKILMIGDHNKCSSLGCLPLLGNEFFICSYIK